MTPIYSQPIIILEGPDGAGKTTLGKALADHLGARYVHLGPMTAIKDLGRIYVEAMLPAIHGYQMVVMDRAWYSEQPYGEVFRDGKLRNDSVMDSMLERIALSCGAVVVYCDTDPRSLVESFSRRRGEEYLSRADQLLDVARKYRERMSAAGLSVVHYDYSKMTVNEILADVSEAISYPRSHKVEWNSNGSLGGRFLLVGDKFTEHQACDPMIQKPFVSFTRSGSSYWITRQLQVAGVPERELCWINQDQGPEKIHDLMSYMKKLEVVICLGEAATEAITKNFATSLKGARIELASVAHPQHQRRFKHHEPYELINVIRGDE